MSRSSPSDCDWLSVAVSILVREGFETIAQIVSDLASRLADQSGEGHRSEPSNVAGHEGQGTSQTQE